MKKPTETMKAAKALEGVRKEAIAAAGTRARQLYENTVKDLNDVGLNTIEHNLGGQTYIEANGDENLIKDWHDAQEGTLQPRPETPEEKGRRETGIEYREWSKDNKLVDVKGEPLTLYHGTMSPTPITDWEAGAPRTEEGEERIPGSGDPNAYLGPHFAVGENAKKLPNDLLLLKMLRLG